MAVCKPSSPSSDFDSSPVSSDSYSLALIGVLVFDPQLVTKLTQAFADVFVSHMASQK
jgi:hypothetical protein